MEGYVCVTSPVWVSLSVYGNIDSQSGYLPLANRTKAQTRDPVLTGRTLATVQKPRERGIGVWRWGNPEDV